MLVSTTVIEVGWMSNASIMLVDTPSAWLSQLHQLSGSGAAGPSVLCILLYQEPLTARGASAEGDNETSEGFESASATGLRGPAISSARANPACRTLRGGTCARPRVMKRRPAAGVDALDIRAHTCGRVLRESWAQRFGLVGVG